MIQKEFFRIMCVFVLCTAHTLIINGRRESIKFNEPIHNVCFDIVNKARLILNPDFFRVQVCIKKEKLKNLLNRCSAEMASDIIKN